MSITKFFLHFFILSTLIFSSALSVNAQTNLSFAPEMGLGTVSPYVTALQEYLNENGYFVSEKAGEPGSPGYETDTFGGATKQALVRFQLDKGILATGFFGPLTRNKVSAFAKASNKDLAALSTGPAAQLGLSCNPMTAGTIARMLTVTAVGPGQVKTQIVHLNGNPDTEYIRTTLSENVVERDCVKLEAMPNDGALFTGWSGSGGYLSGSSSPTLLNQGGMPAYNVNVQANFVVNPTAVMKYPFYASVAGGNGNIVCKIGEQNVDCSTTQPSGTNITVVATPNPGHESKFTSSAVSVAGNNSNDRIYQITNTSVNVLVEFELSTITPPIASSYYSFDARVLDANGSIVCSVSGQQVDCAKDFIEGTVVNVQAIPSPNFTRLTWTSNTNMTTLSNTLRSFVVNKNISVYVGFGADNVIIYYDGKFALNYTKDDHVTVSGATSGQRFSPGTNVTLTLVIDDDYYMSNTNSQFSDMSSILTGSKTISITMDRDRTFDFKTTKKPLLIVTTNTGTGTGTVSADPTSLGQNVTSISKRHIGTVDLTAIADSGSVFKGFKETKLYSTECGPGFTTNSSSTKLHVDIADSCDRPIDVIFDKLTKYNFTLVKIGIGAREDLAVVKGEVLASNDEGGYELHKADGTTVGAGTRVYSISENRDVRLTKLPTTNSNTGLIFLGFSGDGIRDIHSSIFDTYLVHMNGDKTVYAEFETVLDPSKKSYDLKTSKTGKGQGDILGLSGTSQKVNVNTEVTLVAIPKPGSLFTGFKGCTSVQGNICSVITGEKANTVTANFDIAPTFTVKLKKSGTGTGNLKFDSSLIKTTQVAGTVTKTFTVGDTVSIKIEPGPGSYVSAPWAGCSVYDSPATRVSGDNSETCNIDAKYTYPNQVINLYYTINKTPTYSLTISPAMTGKVKIVANLKGNPPVAITKAIKYPVNSFVELKATPEKGYKFLGFENCKSTDDKFSCVVVMTKNQIVKFLVEKVPTYKISTMVLNTGGSKGKIKFSKPVNITATSATLTQGEEVVLVPVPGSNSANTGERFLRWENCVPPTGMTVGDECRLKAGVLTTGQALQSGAGTTIRGVFGK